jgi:hypothetical protein
VSKNFIRRLQIGVNSANSKLKTQHLSAKGGLKTLFPACPGRFLGRGRLPDIYPLANSNQANAKFSRVIRD